MKIKRQLVTLIFIALSVLTCTALIFAWSSYRFFQREAERLMEIKEDYATYLLSLKRLMLEYEQDKEDQEAENALRDEKKKVAEESDEPTFVVVNRDPEYLKAEALRFAKKHKLEGAVRRLYEQEVQPQKEYQGKKTRKRSLTKRRRSPNVIPKKTQDSLSSAGQKQVEEWAQEIALVWPIDRDKFWLSSPFGPRKKPGGAWGFHQGIDMAACKGTPVKAAAGGVIAEAGYVSGYGNTIVVAHNRKFSTRYAHLSRILVNAGDKVSSGQIIGKVGSTGHTRKSTWATDSSHLHFEVVVFRKRVNPLYFLH